MPEDFINKSSRKQKFVTRGGILLVILEIIFTYLAIVSYNNKNLDKYIFGSKDLKNTELFAVMVEDNNGDYKQQSNFPNFPYQFNISKSNCIDNEGNTIKDSLLFDEEKREVIVKTNKTASCYLFFNKPKEAFAPSLINSGELWSSGLEGDGYRYTGSGAYNSETTPDNFICFGTSDKTECKNNEAKYMYRIIGVFEGTDGNQHLKLISLKQLGAYKWNVDYATDVAWENSDMYKGLNGSYFLTNTTYDYLQNNTWLNKIENWTWSAVNTKTWSDSGPDYYNSLSPSQIYLNEMNRSSKTSSIGEWTNPTAKIGLMYASDYALSLGDSALSITGGTSTNRATLKTGWMHQSNNDTTANTYEWTLSRRGDYSGGFSAWYVDSVGYVNSSGVHNANGVRPVFHLTSDVEKLSGKGIYDDPYILRETNENKLKVSASLNGSTMTASITKGDYDLNKYCINNSPSITGCTWNKVTSTTIATEVNEGYTYIHIVDKGGYLVHGSVYYELPKLNNYLIDNAGLWSSGLEGDGYRYTGSGAYNSSTTPNNFICFGTNDKTECKNNEAKYMYRIIGVFEGIDGNQHLKLISLKQLGAYAWNSSNADVNWESSTLYTGLNGSYFLTNTTYDYLQNNTWLNKIENWTWSAVNTKTSSGGPNYYNSLSPSQIYLHEMNRSSKTSSIGEWTNPTAKIGLMYASDYTLSLGSSALAITGDTYTNRATLRTGWMHQSNNDTTSRTDEWTLSRYGDYSGTFRAWILYSDGFVYYNNVNSTYGVRPVFHLKDNVKYKSGSGTYADPYIINE